ncbi:MAG: alpha/beta hydrolase [Aquabacterium sp.]
MKRHDAQWHDQQYNNRARVPDAMAILERWATASAAVRAQHRCALDVPYGASPRERLDIFPADQRGAPVLVFIHGGYWRALTKSDASLVAPAFTSKGATVVVPDYDLCPQVSVETISLQMAQALAWTWRHIGEHGGDPSRIVVVGHSAGGHLAAMMASCRWRDLGADLPPRLIQGALAISGLFDLDPIRQTPFLQADLKLTPASVKRLSPAFFPRPRAVPLYAVAGGAESEEFVRQGKLIRDQWGPTAVPVCESVPGRNHFDVLHNLVEPDGRTHQLALKLLGLA